VLQRKIILKSTVQPAKQGQLKKYFFKLLIEIIE